MKKTLKFTLNQKQLVEGYGYIVLFRDWHMHDLRMAGAIYRGGKFKYYPGRFTNENVTPTFENIGGHHHIRGFYKLPDYREEAL